MQCTIHYEGSHAELMLEERFTFSDNQLFRKTMNELLDKQPERVSLQLEALEYIDSSALGMLLLLRETFDEKEIALSLHKPRGHVKQLFDISRFEDLFTIHH